MHAVFHLNMLMLLVAGHVIAKSECPLSLHGINEKLLRTRRVWFDIVGYLPQSVIAGTFDISHISIHLWHHVNIICVSVSREYS